jgi:predicted RNA-binding Zn ribbon-like protein
MIEPLGSRVIELLNSGALLDDEKWLGAALRRWGFRTDRPLHAGDRAALRELRDLLRRLAESLAVRGTLRPRELAQFNELIGATPMRTQLVALPYGGYLIDLQPLSDDGVERALRELAGEFGSMLRRSYPPRLKLCEGCGAVFWDGTRSRTRRWCDTRTCGNRARVRRHRAGRVRARP